MSRVLCPGLQPYLDHESHLVETTTMRLKVVTPKSLGLARGLSMVDNEITKEVKEKSQNNDGWNFFQSLSSSPQTPKKETSYVHPLVKKSSVLMLSERSLELCTESLGSETGSDTSESSILSLSLFDSRNYTSTKSIPTPLEERNSNSIPQMESRKAISPRSFPPPLTTISGFNSLQVKPHREGGRLIIQAMEAPSTHSYFHTERSHGCLRLSLWENVVETEEEREEINEVDEVLDVQNDMISDDDDDDDQEKEDGNVVRLMRRIVIWMELIIMMLSWEWEWEWELGWEWRSFKGEQLQQEGARKMGMGLEGIKEDLDVIGNLFWWLFVLFSPFVIL